MTDAALPSGRDHAFDEFFENQYGELHRLAYLVTGGAGIAADDLVADALLEVWRHWDRVAAADNPVAYARGVLVNLARTRLRQVRREQSGILGLVASWSERTDTREVDVPTVVDVRAALRRLPYRRRACVVLRYAFDLSEQETARTLGISVGTVKSQTSRGVTQLEAFLGRTRAGRQPGALLPGADRTDSSAAWESVAARPRKPGSRD